MISAAFTRGGKTCGCCLFGTEAGRYSLGKMTDLQSLRGHHASMDQCSSGKIVLVSGFADQLIRHCPFVHAKLTFTGQVSTGLPCTREKAIRLASVSPAAQDRRVMH